MIIDLNEVDPIFFQNKNFDICICGAGVAGITLALNLSKNLNVCLLEAGGLEYSDESQKLYQGNSVGEQHTDLMTSRLRFLGGTSNHWQGWCRPLDSYDFEKKDYVEHSGWPIKRKDLAPYLDEAKSILDIFKNENAPPKGETGNDSKIKPVFGLSPKESPDLKEIDFWFSRPTRFGHKYQEELKNQKNISCILNANVTDIALSENLARVNTVQVHNYDRKSFTIKAGKVILAMGGIENPRIMLNCNRQIKQGLGNSNDLVGRFFCEHPHIKAGEFIFEDRYAKDSESVRFYSPSTSFMQKEKILNFGLRCYKYSNPLQSNTTFKQKIKTILCDLSKDLTRKAFSTQCFNEGLLFMASEQEPNPSSRVTVGAERDQFGMGRVVLDWKLSERDVRTIKLGIEHFAIEFARLGIGRVRIFNWLLADQPEFPGLDEDGIAGHHHMCTTRMGTSAINGVVDSNQKVFGIDNFYVAGSSVFSTAGHANPTFTIVQMSLRLADHLNRMNSH